MKKLNQKDIRKIKASCLKARKYILTMTTLAKSGHPGGSMSAIDMLLVLYNMIDIYHDDPLRPERDRVIISNGHISPAVYSVLGIQGFFDPDPAIARFRSAGSIFEGHVEPEVPGVEWASGNLGQGLSAATGFALACRMKNIKNNIFVIMGDGEQQKGQIGEARRFAVKYNLNNITVLIDYNKLQICGKTQDVMPQNIKNNYLADGWNVIEIDGHDLSAVYDSIRESVFSDKPTAIIAQTIMGKGVSFMENKEKYHGSVLTDEQLDSVLNELGLKNDLEKFKKLRADFVPVKKTDESNRAAIFPIKTGKPKIYREKTDNRSAWGNAIADIAAINKDKKIIPIAVFDCDLQDSVKTGEFKSILPENYFESGIMEHHTAVAAGAMSKENIQVFFADFGVFGVDETYNQHRLNDINRTNLKLITTHVGLDVGEDGKTHQCIDYLGLMRNLYSFKIIVPADPNQTDHIIRYISAQYGNYFVPMGRSKLEIIQNRSGKDFFGEDYQFEYGKADLLRNGDDAALFVMGTFSGKALQIADQLYKKGFSLQVWNVSAPAHLDEIALHYAAKTGLIFTYEDHNVHTGLGSLIADKLMELQLKCGFHKFGVQDYAFSGTSEDVLKRCKLDTDSVVHKILSFIDH